MSKYRIRPFQTGTIIVDKGAYVTRGIGLGTDVEIPATCWYVTDGRRKIMIDTGMCRTELADWHHPGSRQDHGQAVHEPLAFALEPIPPYYKSYEHRELGEKAPFAGVHFETVTGEKEVLPGLTVFPTPGHSPGHQAVALDTDKGTHVVAGDAVFSYDNLKPASPHLPFTVPGRFADVVACWRSLEEIVRRAKVVLPGHDKRVMDVEQYPK